jgi:hypothetical protein
VKTRFVTTLLGNTSCVNPTQDQKTDQLRLKAKSYPNPIHPKSKKSMNSYCKTIILPIKNHPAAKIYLRLGTQTAKYAFPRILFTQICVGLSALENTTFVYQNQ